MVEIDKRQLGAFLDRLDNTGCVVTTSHEGQMGGCYISYLTGCSISPTRLMVFTSHENLTHQIVEASGVLAVHLVSRGQEEWVRRFGFLSGRDVDKFEGMAWHRGVTGSPILEDAAGYMEGRVIASLDCGDHTGRLVEPLVAEVRDLEAVPLTVIEVFMKGIAKPRVHSNFEWSPVCLP